jgi:chromosome segregation ATPase
MKKVDLFYTPTSMKDLEDRLQSFSGGEKAVAWLAAMMAWNLACDIANNEQEDK